MVQIFKDNIKYWKLNTITKVVKKIIEFYEGIKKAGSFERTGF